MQQFINQVVNGLERILFEGKYGESQNFVIYQLSNDYYIQIAGSTGDESVYCEAVGNGFLSAAAKINDGQIRQLEDKGWSKVNGEENHSITLPVDSTDARLQLANFFYETAEIYGVRGIDRMEVHIG